MQNQKLMIQNKKDVYLQIVISEARRAFDKIKADGQGNELGVAIINKLLDVDGPKALSQPLTREETFLSQKLLQPLSEIINSLEMIDDIIIYVRNFPFKRHGISKVSYLRYHIANYLNELYILKNRLIAYVTTISRAYRKSENAQFVHDRLNPLSNIASEAFKDYGKVRGAHVHEERFTDNELERLASLELFSGSDDELGDLAHHIYKMTYKEIRKKWSDKITKDMENMHKIMNHYFEQFIEAVTENGKIKYPSNIS